MPGTKTSVNQRWSPPLRVALGWVLFKSLKPQVQIYQSN